MKTTTISKSTVIKALLTEPLQPGAFFSSDLISKCKVCAVGATLRTHFGVSELKKFRHVGTLASQVTKDAYVGDYEPELERKNYLGALSCYFEREFSYPISQADRRKLVSFVKKNFPTRFKVSIPE